MSLKDFNWQQYLQNYPDLQAAGINTRENAWRHYIRYGKHEGRTFNLIKIIFEGISDL